MNDYSLIEIKEMLTAGNPQEAIKTLAGYLLEKPDSIDGWLLMAELLEDREKINYCFNRCLMIDPENPIVLAKIQQTTLQQAKISDLNSQQKTPEPVQSKYKQMPDKLDQPKDFGFPPLRKPGTTKRPSKVPPIDFDPETMIKDHEERKKANRAAKRKYHKPNWSLIIGLLIAALIFFLAIYGADLAPKDPLEQNTVVNIDGEWHIPPFDPFLPGFPMGSDDIGRDILSRVLHAIRPTLQMVLSVAALRLIIGAILGMIAGWNQGFVGRILDSIISAALAIPVLIVALAGIAAIGVEFGVIAFIVGLSITGWVETARIVRDQTETIRGQSYIEAALALGLSPLQTIFKHVVHQILSIIWVLFAFEISNTLMLTASLGFLGYYIGGDIWVQVSDTSAAAHSGVPELGQMLATARVAITQPWGLIAVGGVVFITVLGFNMIGAGLRNLRNIQLGGRSNIWKTTMGKINLTIDHYILYPLNNFMRTRIFRIAAVSSAILLSGILAYQYWMFYAPLPAIDVNLPGMTEHYWASANHNQYQTSWTNSIGPEEPKVLWIYQEVSGFTGPPVVTLDGLVLLASNSGFLLGLDADMNLVWKIELPALPTASPTLDADGNVFIVDQDGGLMKLTFAGDLLWHFQLETPGIGSASPAISLDGTIYYPVENKVVAVTADGALLYKKQVPDSGYISDQIQISPDQKYLFLSSQILSSADGSIIFEDLETKPDSFIFSSEGEIYLQEDQSMNPWINSSGDQFDSETIYWEEHDKFTLTNPSQSGISPHGHVWYFFGSYGSNLGFASDTRVVWLDTNSRMITNSNFPTRNSLVIGIDQQDVLYTCGNKDSGFGDPSCQAFSFRQDQPVWALDLEYGSAVNGGAIVPNRLYISTEDGYLYAIGADTAWNTEKLAEMHKISLLSANDNGEETSSFYYSNDKEPTVTQILVEPDGFSGGPAIDQENNLYVATPTGTLISLDLNGNILWEIETGKKFFGSLNLDSRGRIVAVTENGGVCWFSNEGVLLQEFTASLTLLVISDAILDSNGDIYLTSMRSGYGHILAISSDGEEKWLERVKSVRFYHPPSLSSSEAYVFFDREIFHASSGEKMEYDVGFQIDRFIGGNNGQDYAVANETIAQMRILPDSISVAEEGIISEMLSSTYGNIGITILEDGTMVLKSRRGLTWFSADGELFGFNYFYDSSIVEQLANETDLTTYICGYTPDIYGGESKVYCGALRPAYSQEDEGAIWLVLADEQNNEYAGAVIIPNHIIVATSSGILAVISDQGIE